MLCFINIQHRRVPVQWNLWGELNGGIVEEWWLEGTSRESLVQPACSGQGQRGQAAQDWVFHVLNIARMETW